VALTRETLMHVEMEIVRLNRGGLPANAHKALRTAIQEYLSDPSDSNLLEFFKSCVMTTQAGLGGPTSTLS